MPQGLSLLKNMRDNANARIDEARRAIASGASAVSDQAAQGSRLLTASLNTAADNFGRNLAVAQGIERQMWRTAAKAAPRLSAAATPPQTRPSKPHSATNAAPRPAAARPTGVRAGIERAAAVSDGAVDAATFGLSDHAAAMALASLSAGQGESILDRYRSQMARSDAQEARDKLLYPNSRKLGQLGGTIVPILATGGASAAPLAFTRIAPLAARTTGWGARALAQRFGPQLAIAAAGGAGSAGVQVVADAADPNRSVNVADTAGAFVGGGTGALATLYGGPRSGATTEAFVTELTRSRLAGEPMSWDAVGDGALAGSYAGRLAGEVGVRWSNGLPPSKYRKRGRKISKEELGELMGETLSRLRLEGVADRQVRGVFKVSGGTTIPDHVTMAGWPREEKFGFGASPTPRQWEAIAEIPDYRVFHFTPDDVGKTAGGVAALIASQAVSRPEQYKSPPFAPAP